MVFISREQLEAAFKERTELTGKVAKTTLAVYFIVVIVIFAEFLMRKHVPLWLYILLLILNMVIIHFSIYVVSFFAFRKKEGGMNAVRLLRFARKYKKLYFLQSTEIASDRVVSYLNMSIAAEKNSFNRFSLICSKFFTHAYRLEPELAYQALDELNRSFDPKLHYRLDLVYTKLSYAMTFCSYEEFRRLCDDNPALYEDSTFRYETLKGYASSNTYDLRSAGHYDEAIDQLDVILEFDRRELTPAGNYYEPAKMNKKVLHYAHLLLDKADMYFMIGDREKSLECVNESDKYAQRATCELYPLFIKDHKDIMHKLYPPQDEQSSPLD